MTNFIPPAWIVFIKPLIIFSIILSSLFAREAAICKNKNSNSSDSYKKAFVSAARINLVVALIPLLFKFIPFLPMILEALSSLNPLLGSIVEHLTKGIAMGIIVLVYYMWQQTNIKQHCNYKPDNIITFFFVILSFFTNISVELYKYVINQGVNTTAEFTSSATSEFTNNNYDNYNDDYNNDYDDYDN